MTAAETHARPVTAPTEAPDATDVREARRRRAERALRVALPLVVVALGLLAWDRVVAWNAIPPYILPGPRLVLATLVADWAILSEALGVTMRIALGALAAAALGGVALAILFAQSRWAEWCFYPFAVILQVTPVIAIAPLIFIYVESRLAGLLLCAWIVAFFPVLSNTTLGLRSTDPNLDDVFAVHGATRWQRLRLLQLPTALPYFLGGLRIAGGLALIGAVVAEYVAGTAGIGSGLAFRILEAGYRLNVARMFAALLLIALAGVAIFLALSALSHLLLRRWHESAVRRE